MIYQFHERNNYAQFHIETIECYLKSLPSTTSVTNVESDKKYQVIDIDLLWEGVNKNNIPIKKSIEVKVDSYYHSGNIFFETISNDNKNSKGCMLVSKADYLFYFFPDIKLLYSFKLEEFKNWTLTNKHRFKMKQCKNPTYNSYGYLIPRNILEKECNFMKRIQLN